MAGRTQSNHLLLNINPIALLVLALLLQLQPFFFSSATPAENARIGDAHSHAEADADAQRHKDTDTTGGTSCSIKISSKMLLHAAYSSASRPPVGTYADAAGVAGVAERNVREIEEMAGGEHAEGQREGEREASGERGAEETVLCVPVVFVISLARRLDKWRTVEARLRAAGFKNVLYFEAIDGRNFSIEEVRRVVSEDAVATLGRRPQRIEELKDLRTLGAIGCFLSHLAVWQAVVERGYERALILEDDVHVDELRDKAWQIFGGGDACSGINWPEVDLLLLGFYDGVGRNGLPYVAERLETGFRCPSDLDRWRGHAYVVTNRGAAVLVSEALPLSVQVDYFMGTLVASSLLTCRAAYGELIREPTSHTGGETDVQEDDTAPIRHLLQSELN